MGIGPDFGSVGDSVDVDVDVDGFGVEIESGSVFVFVLVVLVVLLELAILASSSQATETSSLIFSPKRPRSFESVRSWFFALLKSALSQPEVFA